MAAGSGIYISWLMGAILISVALMPLMKPPWAKIQMSGFVDMFRRYWAHMFVVFSVYLWKDLLDQLDRILMANTQLDMTLTFMQLKEILFFGFKIHFTTIYFQWV